MAIEEASFISSNLDTGQYDTDSQKMTITFQNGSSYTYSGVPAYVWNELQSAQSAGRFLNSEIKSRYPAEAS